MLKDGKSLELAILDLSYDGCKAESSVRLEPGVQLTLSIAGLSGDLNATDRSDRGDVEAVTPPRALRIAKNEWAIVFGRKRTVCCQAPSASLRPFIQFA